MHPSNVVFILFVALATGFFALNVRRLLSYMRLGRSDDRSDRPGSRLGNLVGIALGQSKILRDPVAGVMHALIFWGFMVLTAGTVEFVLEGIFPGFSFRFLPGPLYALYALSQDVFALLVLGAIAFAFYRRLVLHPRRLEGDNLEHLDALVILSMIGGLMVTMLLANGFLAALRPDAVPAAKVISHDLGAAFRGLDPRWSALGISASTSSTPCAARRTPPASGSGSPRASSTRCSTACRRSSCPRARRTTG